MTAGEGRKETPRKSGAVDLTEQELDGAAGGHDLKGDAAAKPKGFWEELPADLQVVKR